MIQLTKYCFLMTVLILVLSSCNDRGEEDMNNSIEDTWKLVSFNYDSESNIMTQGMTIISNVSITSQDVDYELDLTDGVFATNGGYSYKASTVVNGVANEQDLMVSDISGGGTYNLGENEITLDGALLEFTFDGQEFNTASGAQTMPYEINSNGELVFEQDEILETTESGSTVVSTIKSISIWERQ